MSIFLDKLKERLAELAREDRGMSAVEIRRWMILLRLAPKDAD